MLKKNNQKIKAEIFQLSTISKLIPKSKKKHYEQFNKEARKIKNDELGYFTALDNL